MYKKAVPIMQKYEEESQQSQALVEELDSKYEPTQKEVRQYARETLGMVFPQDENMLYLAREGLKAPLPPNWVPYQSRTGDVYYKHRITQDKTYDHPTDLEYLTKFQQLKEQKARKNLKSMNNKPTSAMLPSKPNAMGMNPMASNFIGNPNNNIGNKSSLSAFIPNKPLPAQVDPKLQESMLRDMQQYERLLQQQWKEYQITQRESHKKRITQIRQQPPPKSYDYDKQLTEGKNKIKEKVQAEVKEERKIKIKQKQHSLSQNFIQFQQIHIEDYRIQQQKLIAQYQRKISQYNQGIKEKRRLQKEKKVQNTARMNEQIKLLRQRLSQPNEQIRKAVSLQMQLELQKIHLQYTNRINQHSSKLQEQLTMCKKMLNCDTQSYLQNVNSKKQQLQEMTKQKINSRKTALLSKLRTQQEQEFIMEKKKIELEMGKKSQTEIKAADKLAQSNMQKAIEHMNIQYNQKIKRQIETVFRASGDDMSKYQTQMNKRITALHSQFIKEIQCKQIIQSPLSTKQQEMETLQLMVNGLKRQLQLEQCTHKLLKINHTITQLPTAQIQEYLQRTGRELGLKIKPEAYIKYKGLLAEQKHKLKTEKQRLTNMMLGFQHAPSLNTALLRQYNEDVKHTRINQTNIQRMEVLLKKAETNDKTALQQLEAIQFVQCNEEEKPNGMKNTNQQTSFFQVQNQKEVQYKLKEHSKFLSNMKRELNKKLYQARNKTYCNSFY